MRHNYKGRKLGTDYSHTKAMKRSLVSALFLNDRIKTVESRAKEIRGDVDHIITLAKRGDLHSRRLAMAAFGNDSELVREIFEKVAQGMFADRQGGYTRIIKLGNRKGDNAPMVIMELVSESLPAKKKSKAKSDSAKAKAKPATKKATGKSEKKDEKPQGEKVVATEDKKDEEAKGTEESASDDKKESTKQDDKKEEVKEDKPSDEAKKEDKEEEIKEKEAEDKE